MPTIKDLLLFRWFSEKEDVAKGPRWVIALFLISSFIAQCSMAVGTVALFMARHQVALNAYLLMIVFFAVMSGFSWHLGLRGRAKNGLLVTALMYFALTLISGPVPV